MVMTIAEKVQKFDVIGGQYKPYYYGTAETLDEAKKMAFDFVNIS